MPERSMFMLIFLIMCFVLILALAIVHIGDGDINDR